MNATNQDIIPSLIARRVKVSASSPEGRRLSMLIEQMKNPDAAPYMAQTVREIEQIRRDGGRYVHANHGAAR